jgi:hypothetical protein
MKLIKSLLLASTASVTVATGVYAADLPSRKSAPIEYVRICDAYGAGFFYIPGTDTCLKVGGLAYGEERALTQGYQMGSSTPTSTFYGNGTVRTAGTAGAVSFPQTGFLIPNVGSYTNARARDDQGSSALGRIELDARTQTGYGTVRSFIRVDAFYGSGANASTGSLMGTSGAFNTVAGTQGARETTIVNKAFIQFAGLTAGRAQSVFDFYADAYNYANLRGSDATVELLSYTYTFGGGFSATISIEDNDSRRTAIGSTVASATAITVAPGVPAGNANFAGTSFQALPQGNRLPEIVGNLRYDAPWGAVQLSGALHQIDASLYGSGTTTASISATAQTAYAFPSMNSDKIGGAVQLGVMLNADMISPGDKLWLQGAFESGAYSYIAGNNLASSYGSVNGNRFAGDAFTPMDNSVFWNPNPGYDCVFTGSGSCETQTGWDITAAYKHYWIPTLASALYGSYEEVHYSNNALLGFSGFGATTVAGGAATGFGAVGVTNPKEGRLGTNLVWTPIKGFDIGGELIWIHLTQSRPVGLASDATLLANGLPAFKASADQGEARIRVQRAF